MIRNVLRYDDDKHARRVEYGKFHLRKSHDELIELQFCANRSVQSALHYTRQM